MTVDDRFDLFGMDLEAADVNDSPAATAEMIAPVVQLENVTRVDEALGIKKRRAFVAQVAPRCARRADT